jgi:hypothetical protein
MFDPPIVQPITAVHASKREQNYPGSVHGNALRSFSGAFPFKLLGQTLSSLFSTDCPDLSPDHCDQAERIVAGLK